MVLVRPATAADAEAWCRIVREAADEPTPGIVTRPEEVRTPAQQAEVVAQAAPERDVFLVAEVEGAVAGVASGHRGARAANRHTMEVGLTVAASHRGRGVGRALMLGLEARAREMGVTKVCLGVFEDNERARRLYRSLGYVEEGTRRGQYLVAGRLRDEVLMAKRLRDAPSGHPKP